MKTYSAVTSARNRRIVLFLSLAALFQVFLCGIPVAQQSPQSGKEEALFLDLRKIGLGTLSGLEEKKRYLVTIQLEKQRIQAHMLRGVYDNAFELYKKGDFEQVQELAGKILSIDPNFQDASLLIQASGQLKGSLKPILSERMMIEDRFKEGLVLYREGRLVEAVTKLEEVIKLSPGNLKARYWLGKVNDELAEEHMKRGEESYSRRRYKEALDRWYSALLLRPNNRRLTALISTAENELRQEEAGRNLQAALDFYGQGRLDEAYRALKKIQEIQPGDNKAQKLLSEIKFEIAGRHIAEGKKLYSSRRYSAAIEEWKIAGEYGYDARYVDQLTARAKEQMKMEEDEKRRRSDEEKREAEEARQREKAAAESAAKAKQPSSDTGAVSLPTGGVSEENKRSAQQHYLEGLRYFQNANMEKARDEWTLAKQLDPGHADADAGLKRIDQILSGGQ